MEIAFRTFDEPKIKSCVKAVTDQGWFNWGDPVETGDARRLCEWIEERESRERRLRKELYGQKKLEKLNKHIRGVGWVMLEQIRLSNLSSRTKRVMSERLDSVIPSESADFDWILKRAPSGQAAFFNNGKRQIWYSPYFMALLDQPQGEQFLWTVTAHELGHLLTMEGYELQPEFLNDRPGDKSMRACISDAFNLNKYDKNNTDLLSEATSDILSQITHAQGPADVETPEEWGSFMNRSLTIFCEIFEANKSRKLSAEWVEQDYLFEDHHPLIWDRIYMYFRNNKIRKNLGCEPIQGEDYLCGF